MRMFVDHTGEVYENRRITGPGTYRKTPHDHGHWTWRWICLECGATGEATFVNFKGHRHVCPGTHHGRSAGHAIDTPVRRQEPERPKTPRSRLCGPQCKGGNGYRPCGHYSPDVKGCLYILDTGRVRPKVDLRKEPCPVRDTSFKRPIVAMEVGEVIVEGKKDEPSRCGNTMTAQNLDSDMRLRPHYRAAKEICQ